MAERIQLKRTKGWRKPVNTVVVSRPGKYGNPFVVGRDGTAAECVERFRAWLEGNPLDLEPLRGKNLACWCRLDQPCHADVLLEACKGRFEGRGVIARIPAARCVF